MNFVELLKIKSVKINLSHLSELKNAVKFNFSKIKLVSSILEDYPFLKDDLKNRIDNGILPQPGRISETLIAQSISNNLDCKYEGNGIYENENYCIIQDGGSGKSDLIILNKVDNKKYTFEIKEPIAYGKSCGFTYDDNGFPVDFTSKDEKYREYVRSLFEPGNLLENYNILQNIGHNKVYSIDDILTNRYDFIISFDIKGTLLIMTLDEYKNNFNFKIEVRSCGRNGRKVFTKNKLNLFNDYLILTKEEILDITQRGGVKSSRYKYIHNNSTFSFKKKDLEEENNKLKIHVSKIKQHVGEVAIQHFKKK